MIIFALLTYKCCGQKDLSSLPKSKRDTQQFTVEGEADTAGYKHSCNLTDFRMNNRIIDNRNK